MYTHRARLYRIDSLRLTGHLVDTIFPLSLTRAAERGGGLEPRTCRHFPPSTRALAIFLSLVRWRRVDLLPLTACAVVEARNKLGHFDTRKVRGAQLTRDTEVINMAAATISSKRVCFAFSFVCLVRAARAINHDSCKRARFEPRNAVYAIRFFLYRRPL